MSQIFLKFKNEGIKNMFMNNKLVDSIFEGNIKSSALSDLMSEGLEIKNPENISFINDAIIQDFITVASIYKLDYIFYIENETTGISMYSSLYGNVKILNNSEITDKSVSFDTGNLAPCPVTVLNHSYLTQCKFSHGVIYRFASQ